MELSIIPLAFGLGLWAHWRYALSRTRDEVQASCRHRWGKTWEVGTPALYYRERFYMQTCPICAAHRHVNADGTVYVPKGERREK